MTVRLDAHTTVAELPKGYRWATALECETWDRNFDRMVQVRQGGTDDDPQTDLAIREATSGTHTVVESSETYETYVKTSGGYMLTEDWYTDGGRVEKWDAEIMGEPVDLGRFTNKEIEVNF